LVNAVGAKTGASGDKSCARRAYRCFCGHRREGPALPKYVERGTLTLDQAVIRWARGGGSGAASPQPCRSPWRVAGREKVFA
jgi:hypothetical protein